MELKLNKQCDVFVIGAGLAGIRAAIEMTGCHVIVSSSTHIFSGSSFYPGTWGLGLIGPKDCQDNMSLINSIHHVGCHMCDKRLVDVFVNDINDGINEIKNMGVKLKQATDQSQKEFIPCFDNKQRNWNGLLFDSLKDTFSKKLKDKEVELLECHEVIDIVYDNKQVCGVIVCNQNNQLSYIGCKSIIIASGGFGGIYKYRLNTLDINGIGQYLALKCGASLVNIEFIQMMLGFTSPSPKTIYNEKMFKYTKFYKDNQQLFVSKDEQELLKIRSTYGPFTSRLPSKLIDIVLFKQFIKEHNSIIARHDASLKDTNIEFIQTYFDWLEKEKHISIEDDIHLGIFYHAANGGIKIDENGSTGIKGMYACGEVTGGMHGADRIGGLSSANGLVFGKRVGKSVQDYISKANVCIKDKVLYEQRCIKDSKKHLNIIQNLMSQYAMIVRNEEGLKYALDNIQILENTFEYCDDGSYIDTTRLLAAFYLSKALLNAMIIRKESRGSHYREDYPIENKEFEYKINIYGLKNMKVDFDKGE
ncbi:MAG: FAD-binding protein [Coprobacillus sp.]